MLRQNDAGRKNIINVPAMPNLYGDAEGFHGWFDDDTAMASEPFLKLLLFISLAMNVVMGIMLGRYDPATNERELMDRINFLSQSPRVP